MIWTTPTTPNIITKYDPPDPLFAPIQTDSREEDRNREVQTDNPGAIPRIGPTPRIAHLTTPTSNRQTTEGSAHSDARETLLHQGSQLHPNEDKLKHGPIVRPTQLRTGDEGRKGRSIVLLGKRIGSSERPN